MPVFESSANADEYLAHFERRMNDDASKSRGFRRRHGIRLFLLPSDFLCSSCQEHYLHLDICSLSDADVNEWCARMQCATFRGDTGKARAFLVSEQMRFFKRTEVMELASKAAASLRDQSAAFASFQELLDPTAFERSEVESAINLGHRRDAVRLFGYNFAT